MEQSKTALSFAGFLIGFLVGLGDYIFFESLGIQMTIGSDDVTFWVVFFFACNFGILGWVIVRLYLQKKEIKSQTTVIMDQLDELELAQHKLVESEKLAAIGRVAASVAHEVRNPLGVIKSSAELVSEDVEGNEEAQKALSYIGSEVDRLDLFVKELLEYAKPLETLIKRHDLSDWADDLERALDPQPVVFEIEREVGSAYFSPELLTQLTLELVQNAREHAEKIEVHVYQGGNGIRIEVVDDGPGIDPADLDTIFEPFVTHRVKGTGLGLATAHKIAEVHKGRLGYLGGVGLGPDGRGACFEFEMPR